jgi:hypothetical protein
LLRGGDGQVRREVASAQFALKLPDPTAAPLPLSVALIRDHRRPGSGAGPNGQAQGRADWRGVGRVGSPQGGGASAAPTCPQGPRLIPIVSNAQTVDPLELVA